MKPETLPSGEPASPEWVDRYLALRREDAVLALGNGRLTRFTTEGKDDDVIMAATAARIAAEVFGMPDLPVAAALEALTQRAPAGR
jgi:hypothetical protein